MGEEKYETLKIENSYKDVAEMDKERCNSVLLKERGI